ncbi:ATP-grasp domain-containing protein [Neolewinella antarctica]|uniref:Ribosomal protein S6--L-glutamate ligase n=1 Tax=Neolewinella antarctica TaxID=442734 RepID=A0ABX0X783_9BACT|nr:RimK family alpha-L-glutamate ligase [Neolewinella antarctica]NJC24861.1 ribosomal protein S6--L-glutamate ligase [Neolewinella antarctica]
MRITVFSRGPTLYSTSRIVAAGEARGHTVEVIDHAFCNPALEAGRHCLLYDGQPLRTPTVVVPRIGANMTVRGASLLRQLDTMSVPHTMSADGLLLARDKMGSLQALAKAGLPVPTTILCFNLREVRLAALRLGDYPIVVKMLEGTHGEGVALAHNLLQLEKIARRFIDSQSRVILQEYVAESQGTDVRAFVVGNQIVATMQRRATDGEFRANMHLGASALPITLSEADQLIVLRAAAVLNVEIAGVDLIPSNEGYLIVEVNASPGLEGIETTTGQDVAGEIIEYAIKKTKA